MTFKQSWMAAGLLMALSGASAYADCSAKYLEARADAEKEAMGYSELGGASFALSVMTTTTAGSTAGAAFPLMSTTAYSYVNSQGRQLEKAMNLIKDAQAGDGLILREFAKDTGLTLEAAAQFVRRANENLSLCSGRDLMNYSEIVSAAELNR